MSVVRITLDRVSATAKTRAFTNVLVNTLIANVTTSFLWFALTFWVYIETESVLATGVIGGAYMLLIAFFSMVFGTIVDRYRTESGGLDWEAVYADEEARVLVNDVLLVVSHHFANVDKRRDWFMTLVNNNLGPAYNEADARWQLTEFRFYLLMEALFADLRKEVVANSWHLRQRYGDMAYQGLADLLTRLEEG